MPRIFGVALVVVVTGCSSGGVTTSTGGGSGGASTSTTGSTSSKATVGVTTTSGNASASATSATASTGSGATDFPSRASDGPWFVGDKNSKKYSWIRFIPDPKHQEYGVVEVLEPLSTSLFKPLFPCNGQGVYQMDVSSQLIHAQLPSGCANSMADLYFMMFAAPPTTDFPQSDLGAQVIWPMFQVPLVGARFPSTFCDPSFMNCNDPTQ